MLILMRFLIRFLIRFFELALLVGLVAIAGIRYYVDLQTQSFAQMKQSGKIRVLISDEPDSVYLFNKQHFGFEYELLKRFANQNQLDVELEIVPFAELFALLESGAGDIAVGGILENPFVKRVAQPTLSWYQASTTVVYRRGTGRPLSIDQLNDESVMASARYYQLDGFEPLQLKDDHRSEYELLNDVAAGRERFAISTNYRAENAKHYLPELNRSFILPNRVNLVWALPKRHDPKLLEAINDFLRTAIDQQLPQRLADDYLDLPKKLSTYDALYLHRKIKTSLPNYEYAFRRAARGVGVDWTLLAALAYQESRWSNEARSPTGVRGIMQMTQRTAESLGVDDRMDMNQSISAAARYLIGLRNRLPERIKEPERTWFALGAYNVGYKHILNAYRKARDLGLDKTQWGVVSELLPTLYGERFSKGVQARDYVERVQIFNDILRFYDLHQRDEILLAPTVLGGP